MEISGYGGPSRYVALADWLLALPAEQRVVFLTFEQISDIIGVPLPSSAASARFWTASIIADLYWRSAGFSARLERANNSVRFTRVER